MKLLQFTGKILFVLLFSIILFSCNNSIVKERPLTIAISKASPQESYINYIKYLKEFDSTVILINMYELEIDSAISLLTNCDGLLLTGGTDVYPGQYGKESDTSRCWKTDFKRDSLEFGLIEQALDLKLPILAICRGLQILNIHLGGSLVIDIPSDFDTLIKHQCKDKFNCLHEVEIEKSSLLHNISNVTKGNTNSNHHQGIDILSPALKGIAMTNDGLIEAIQFKNSNSDQFLLGVQWHPERMDYNNPLSGPIARRFLKEAKRYNNQN